MRTIGDRIKRARHNRGFSQAALARATKVSQPTVANWENGSHAPRQHVLNALARTMNVSSHYLLNGDEDENGATLAPSQYLQSAIRHVPIRNWPSIEDVQSNALTSSVSHDYLAISTNAHIPFALIAKDENMADVFPIGATIIFDAKPGPLEDGAYYLFLHTNQIILRRFKHMLMRGADLNNQGNESTDLIFSPNLMPLARALISVRQH